jgi:hypothetical protein
VAISNHRLVRFQEGTVTFRWKDYAHGNQKRIMTLTADVSFRQACVNENGEGDSEAGTLCHPVMPISDGFVYDSLLPDGVLFRLRHGVLDSVVGQRIDPSSSSV